MPDDQVDDTAIRVAVNHSKSRSEMWARLISQLGIQDAAEVGVWRGQFAETLLRTCAGLQTYFMIDPWRPLDNWNKPMNIDSHTFEEVYGEALQRTEFARERRAILRGTTLEVSCRIADASLDFVYVDGDHTLRGVTIDLITWYAKVKPGRYIGGDDFCPSIWQHSRRFEPTLVFPFAINFAEAVRATVFCLPFNQFLIQKPREGQDQFAIIDFTGQYRDAALLPHLTLARLMKSSMGELLPRRVAEALRYLLRGRVNSSII